MCKRTIKQRLDSISRKELRRQKGLIKRYINYVYSNWKDAIENPKIESYKFRAGRWLVDVIWCPSFKTSIKMEDYIDRDMLDEAFNKIKKKHPGLKICSIEENFVYFDYTDCLNDRL